ncbi:MAG TPA: RNase J family beta-CASP ribonuclease, partial [Candidatus Moranbacteria bacterium]|nr:RNase J family beta-CASP ribonuclease [Candidatus Moranbacteria bacterium]
MIEKKQESGLTAKNNPAPHRKPGKNSPRQRSGHHNKNNGAYNLSGGKKRFSQSNPSQENPKSAHLRITPLGGNEEVGRNMTIFEYGGDIIILDMGIQFPEEDMPGVDYIVPDASYLKGKED